MRKLIRIGGALVAGILLVLGAFYMSQLNQSGTEGEIVVVSSTSRNFIETQDLDENGVPDWKEGLDGLTFETIDTPPVKTTGEESEEYVPPTTFTGKFSVAFLRDYLSGKTKGLSFDDPTAFVGSAIEAIGRNTQSKKHTRLDIVIIDSDFESLRDYGNVLASTIRPSTLTETEDMLILRDALSSKNPEILDKLAPIQEATASTLSTMAGIGAPSILASEHVKILDFYESMYENIGAMSLVFDDPLYTLARVGEYTKDLQSLGETIQIITKVLTESGVVYTKDEPGAQLYLFDI